MKHSGIQIIGTQRSGSNLLRVILDQSPAIASPHPPHILVTFMPIMHLYGPLDAVSYRQLVADVVAYVNANPVPWDDVFLHEQELFEQSENYDLFTLNRLVYEKAARSKKATYWCCKSMANVHYASQMEAFGLQPKYIYLYRDGRDVACSFKKAVVGEKHAYHLAQQWKKDQQACIHLRQALPADRFYSLNYETLIAEPEQEIRRLCDYLEIEYQADMLQFHTSKASKSTAAAGEMWRNLEKPIMTNNTGKFLAEFKENELEIFEFVAGDTLSALGYTRYTAGVNADLVSSEMVAQYDKENEILKREALVLARPSDLENRAPQLAILKDIKARAIDIKPILEIALEAGASILQVYNDESQDFKISSKSDNSPLTLADMHSHAIITDRLTALYPHIPVLSEEGATIDYEIRKHWTRYWCVDPLDGTKEFINRNGEFTVNIALIENNEPVMGVIYSPVLNVLYYGSLHEGSFKMTPGQPAEAIRVNDKKSNWTAVGSRSHASPEDMEILQKFPISQMISIGSSLKFCLIADGTADMYYRSGPTMEWDTAAGHAIAVSAGAVLLNASKGKFYYNKPSLLNPGFFCYAVPCPVVYIE